jgi:hypothetical protein
MMPSARRGRGAVPIGAVSSADKEKVMSDPLVRQAIELTDGSLAGIRREVHTISEDADEVEGKADSETVGA